MRDQAQYDTFVQRYQPTDKDQPRCQALAPASVGRATAHYVLPVMIGLGAGMLAAWTEREAGLAVYPRLIETSCLTVACAVTLGTACMIARLLNWDDVVDPSDSLPSSPSGTPEPDLEASFQQSNELPPASICLNTLGQHNE